MGFEARSSFETYKEVKDAVTSLEKSQANLTDEGLLLDSKGGYTYGTWANPIVGTIPINIEELKEQGNATIIFSGASLAFSGVSVLFRTNVPDTAGVYEVGVIYYGKKICVYVPNASGAPPLGDLQSPTAPSNLSSANIGSTTLDLLWDASTDNIGVTGYDIYQNGTFLVSVSTLNHTVTSLLASTSYSFYVIAKDAVGNPSPQSNTINIATTSGGGGGNPPEAPSLSLSEFTYTIGAAPQAPSLSLTEFNY